MTEGRRVKPLPDEWVDKFDHTSRSSAVLYRKSNTATEGLGEEVHCQKIH